MIAFPIREQTTPGLAPNRVRGGHHERGVGISIYRKYWQYWTPGTYYPEWRPSAGRAADEDCNPSIAITLPLVGGFVFFWRFWRRRDGQGPCPRCVADSERYTNPRKE